MNSKMASYEETCEYCKCLLSDWLFWRWNGKKYCSESCAEYDKKNEGDERMWGQNKSFPFGIL